MQANIERREKRKSNNPGSRMNDQRKNQGKKRVFTNYNEKRDLWLSGFSSEVSSPSSSYSSNNRWIIHLWRVCASLHARMACTTSHLFEPSDEEKRTSDRVTSQNREPSFLNQVSKAITEQARGMTNDFKSNGLPWKGPECRSILAGGSGVLYCLPAFFCKSNRTEQCVWLMQALLSVMADYVYVDKDSCIHGIDRFFATANAVAIISRAAYGLNTMIATLAIIPLSTFVLANRSKQQLNVQRWIYYHFLWHLTGSICIAFVIDLLYTCPDYDEDVSTENLLLDRFCPSA